MGDVNGAAIRAANFHRHDAIAFVRQALRMPLEMRGDAAAMHLRDEQDGFVADLAREAIEIEPYPRLMREIGALIQFDPAG